MGFLFPSYSNCAFNQEIIQSALWDCLIIRYWCPSIAKCDWGWSPIRSLCNHTALNFGFAGDYGAFAL